MALAALPPTKLVGIVQRFPYRDIFFVCPNYDFINRSIPNAPFWQIDDPSQRLFIVGIQCIPQIGQQIFNFFSLVKRQSAYNLVFDVHAPQGIFHRTGLAVGSV
jgi:hypothetical protein